MNNNSISHKVAFDRHQAIFCFLYAIRWLLLLLQWSQNDVSQLFSNFSQGAYCHFSSKEFWSSIVCEVVFYIISFVKDQIDNQPFLSWFSPQIWWLSGSPCHVSNRSSYSWLRCYCVRLQAAICVLQVDSPLTEKNNNQPFSFAVIIELLRNELLALYAVDLVGRQISGCDVTAKS